MPPLSHAFSGSIPAVYDRYLESLLFGPYAEDIAARAVALNPRHILETASGTGVVTVRLARLLPQAQLIATDLNEPMLSVAASKAGLSNVEFRQADAQSLPFDGESFDVVVCQFGVMFFPDRIAAFREVRRVLKPAGHFIFNVWGRIEDNPATQVAADAVCELFESDPPRFFHRVPFGYHDLSLIREELDAADFEGITMESVRKQGRADTPMAAAVGLCQGTPLRNEIEVHGDLELATKAAAEALSERFGTGPIEAAMSAHVVCARK